MWTCREAQAIGSSSSEGCDGHGPILSGKEQVSTPEGNEKTAQAHDGRVFSLLVLSPG
jgi:hypothetical protein